jgi:hypothetical protein
MPLYDYVCEKCGKSESVLSHIDCETPICCGLSMGRLYTGGCTIKEKYPLWVNRMEDIHKKQQEHGERLRLIHPKEVLC